MNTGMTLAIIGIVVLVMAGLISFDKGWHLLDKTEKIILMVMGGVSLILLVLGFSILYIS